MNSYVGIDLSTPVFAHGQLYVAFSRCKSWSNIKCRVKNVGIQGRRTINDISGVFTINHVIKSVLEKLNVLQ